MRSGVRCLLAISILSCLAVPISTPSAVRLRPAVLRLQRRSSPEMEPPPPCDFPCGGELRCDKGQFGYCECPNGKCQGSCRSQKAEALDLAADVLSVVFEEGLNPSNLREMPQKYRPVLDDLLKNKASTGRYHLKYKDRRITFAFSEQSVVLLTDAARQLH